MLKVERRFLCARPIAAFLSPIYLTYCNEMESIALFLTEMSLMQAAALIIASLASLYWVFRRRPELPPGPCSLFNMNPLGMLLHFASEKNAGKNHELFHSWCDSTSCLFCFNLYFVMTYCSSFVVNLQEHSLWKNCKLSCFWAAILFDLGPCFGQPSLFAQLQQCVHHQREERHKVLHS